MYGEACLRAGKVFAARFIKGEWDENCIKGGEVIFRAGGGLRWDRRGRRESKRERRRRAREREGGVIKLKVVRNRNGSNRGCGYGEGYRGGRERAGYRIRAQ